MRLRVGDRAAVTGASFGIGEAIARELAGRGLDLVLIARTASRLEELAHELSGTVRVETYPCDLTQALPDVAAIGRIDVLVNNAGVGQYGPTAALSPASLSEMLDLNVRALAHLCHAVLPGMLGQGRGAILNVASTAGFVPLPYLSCYAATKAFVISLSCGLAAEYRRHGVTVTALCPGYTETRFHALANNPSPTLLRQDAATVARRGVAALDAGRMVAVPGWYNQVTAWAGRLTSPAMAARLLEPLYRPPSG